MVASVEMSTQTKVTFHMSLDLTSNFSRQRFSFREFKMHPGIFLVNDWFEMTENVVNKF